MKSPFRICNKRVPKDAFILSIHQKFHLLGTLKGRFSKLSMVFTSAQKKYRKFEYNDKTCHKQE